MDARIKSGHDKTGESFVCLSALADDRLHMALGGVLKNAAIPGHERRADSRAVATSNRWAESRWNCPGRQAAAMAASGVSGVSRSPGNVKNRSLNPACGVDMNRS